MTLRKVTRPRLFQRRENTAPDDPKKARRAAMDFLARREHGAEELIGKLGRKGFDDDVARAVAEQLAEDGLQCDERYAESVVSARINQGKGPLHIRHGLKRSGIASSTADAAMAAAQVDWQDLARAVREKRFGPESATEPSEHARQMRFLLQRGFSSELARRAIDS